MFAGVPVHQMAPAAESADISQLVGLAPDLAMSFCAVAPDPRVLGIPRLGTWAFRFGQRERNGPVGFWEVRHLEPVVHATLERLADGRGRPGAFRRAGIGPTNTLVDGAFGVVAHSWARTRDRALLGVVRWPAKAVRDLACGALEPVEPVEPVEPLGDPGQRPASGTASAPPGQSALLAHRLAQPYRFARSQLVGIARAAKWNVGVVPVPIDELPWGPLPPTRWFPDPPRGEFLADPFIWTVDGQPHVLLERLDQRTGTGVLEAFELAGNPAPAMPAPTVKGHLSYPFTVTAGGETYCIPESAEAAVVRLFRFERSTSSWVVEGDLITDRRLLDATVVQHDGRWWLFATDADSGRTSSLHVWWAPELRGPWREHAGNPVKTDVRSARGAGTPFRRDGRLLRPAQDCSLAYGSRIVLNEVTHLTPTAFAEQVVGRIEPDPAGPYPHGVHTVAAAGRVTLVDGKRFELAWGDARRELAARLRRLAR